MVTTLYWWIGMECHLLHELIHFTSTLNCGWIVAGPCACRFLQSWDCSSPLDGKGPYLQTWWCWCVSGRFGFESQLDNWLFLGLSIYISPFHLKSLLFSADFFLRNFSISSCDNFCSYYFGPMKMWRRASLRLQEPSC